jgi:hypothetical protein
MAEPEASPSLRFGSMKQALSNRDDLFAPCFQREGLSMIMHNWTTRHWVFAALIIGLAAGAFVLSWA